MTILRLIFWADGEESGKSGTWVLSRTDRINFSEKWFSQIRPVLTETEGSLSMIFLDWHLRSSSKLSQLQIQIRLVPVEWLMERYFRYDLADQLVVKNPILLWESFCNHLCWNFSLLSVYLNEKQRSKKKIIIYENNYEIIMWLLD